jgi:uncharacterized protein
VRFWDASAVLPVCVAESTSSQMKAIHQGDPDVVVWWGSRVECVSALCRLVREGRMTPANEVRVRSLLTQFLDAAHTVAPTDDIRARAERCLAVHPLRAADALQLGAALVWANERPSGLGFVSLDTRLRDAARREGFSVLPA